MTAEESSTSADAALSEPLLPPTARRADEPAGDDEATIDDVAVANDDDDGGEMISAGGGNNDGGEGANDNDGEGEGDGVWLQMSSTAPAPRRRATTTLTEREVDADGAHPPKEKDGPAASASGDAHHIAAAGVDSSPHVEASSAVTASLVGAIAVASATQFLVGYNIGVMNAPVHVVFPGHTTASWSLAVAAFSLGGPPAAYVAGSLADRLGRRGAQLVATLTFFVGGTAQALALDMAGIILSRFVVGFAAGMAGVLTPVYLGEISPPSMRGAIGTLTQVSIVFGILASDLLAFPLATEERWRLLFAVTAVVAAVQLLCTPLLLESPRWLLGRVDAGSKLKARTIVRRLRRVGSDEEVDAVCLGLVGGGASPGLTTTDEDAPRSDGDAPSAATAATYRDMFTDGDVRIMVITGCLVLPMAQQLSGINAVFYYSTTFFTGVISDPLVGTTLVGAVNVAATLVALLLMDRVGRRTLILWSSGGMFVCCVLIVLSLLGAFGGASWAPLAAVNLYVSFFELGLGPIPFLIVPELFDARYVALAMSASMQVNYACNFLVGLIFPYLERYLGPFSFAPFAVVLLATFAFSALVLPETRGRSHEEVKADVLARKRRYRGVTTSEEEGSDNGNADDGADRNTIEGRERHYIV